ncbi:MAG: right-handed parallel beta-helix repeat-containing protein, partial [Thermoplasmata archaeon]|nr:right-handed parallel beta-helix repeat-containing protein [Thermoplasmata archaeon]
NLSNAGWFIDLGIGAVELNDSYVDFNYDTIEDGTGTSAAYLYQDADAEFEHDVLANNSNAGILAGANVYLTVDDSDLSSEYYVTTSSVGVWVNTSSDVYVDDNNLSNEQFGVVDIGVSDHGEFDSNIIGSDGQGVTVENGNSFSVEGNVIGAGLFPDSAGIVTLGGSYAEIADNLLEGSTSVGIEIQGGDSMSVYGNNVSGNEIGVEILDSIASEAWANVANDTTVISFYSSGSSGTEFESNYATGASIGTYITGGEGAVISGNDLDGASSAAVLVASVGSTEIWENNLTDASTGVVVQDSFSTTISLNQFVGTPHSLAIFDSDATVVYQNDFVNVGVGGWEIGGDIGLWWNASYPYGGNYWSNDTPTTDTQGGPGQNISGSDGINDTPFVQGQGAVIDHYPLVYPIATAPPELVFTATGLPEYSQWRMTVNVTYPGLPVQSYSTYDYVYSSYLQTATVELQAGAIGTYTYSVEPVSGWVATPSSGSGNTPRGTFTTAIVYTPFLYTVSFAATGISSGTSWNVTVNGHKYTSTTLWDNVSLGNGTYTWTATSSSAPSVSGNVTVHTAAATVTVAFHPPTYAIVFTQAGLPAGATWSVSLNGDLDTSSGSVIVYTVVNGSYAYTVTNSGTATPSSLTGTVVVNGAGQGVAESFSSPASATPPGTFAVVFTETGLASGASWTVSLNGVPQTATGDAISFDEKNGTFAYTVTSTGSVAPTPASGSVTVTGSAIGTAIAFGTSGSTTTTPAGTNTGISATDLYAVIAVAIILGILAAIGWTRGRGGSSNPPPTPPAWSGPMAPAGAPPPGAGTPPPAWQEPPAGGPPSAPPPA